METKQIKDFENYYIREDGAVISYAQNSPKILKPGTNKGGYLTINLSKNNSYKTLLVHRLVAEAFIPNPNNYPCALHKDDNRLNPHKDNIFWGTKAMNSKDMVSKGRCKSGQHLAKKLIVTWNGIRHEHSSIRQAAKAMGWPLSSLHKAIKEGKTKFRGFGIKVEARDELA